MLQRNHLMQWGLAVILMLSIVFTGSAFAQTTTQGSITGTVFDTTGAVIPSASVKIVNDGTNAEIDLVADGSGFFTAPLLEPGLYTVTVSAKGFGAYHATSVVVTVSQVTELSPKLNAGATGATIEVSGSAPIMNFESPDFTSSLNTRAIQNIPINNRRWSALALTTPGVVADSSGFGLVSVRGISTLLNNVEVDGADDNQAYYSEERGRTREAYSTSGSAIREFQVETGVYSAEFGRAAGGVINSVTKSGTNVPHGQVYFYDRESNWNAKNDYTTLTTLSATGTNTTSHIKPEDVRKIYGFTVGGPLIKDKLFFMYTYDQHSHIFPAIATPSAPATFYATPDAGAANVVTNGANSWTCTANGFLAPVGAAPAASAIDSDVCTMAARLGKTYSATATIYNGDLSSLSSTDLGLIGRTGYQEINTPKLDWQVDPKEHVSVLFHRLRWDSPGGVQTQNPVFYGIDTTGTDFVKLDYGVTKLTSLITSNISNEILYQYGRELNDEGQTPYSSYTKTNLTGPTGDVPEVALASGGGGLTFGSPYYSYRIALPDERKWQIEDTLYYSKGNHTFKFGGDLLHNADLLNNTFESNGVYSYAVLSTYFTDLAEKSATPTCNSTASSTAATAASVTFGASPCYTSYVQGFGPPVFAIATFDWAAFAQDNWKVSPRLTVELGIRYDQELIPAEQAAYVNAAVGVGTTSPLIPANATAGSPSDKNNFGPRVGFSYDVYGSGKTVLRGGFGVYYGRITNGVLMNAQLETATAAAQYTTSYKPAASGATPAGPQFPNIVANGLISSPAIEYLDPHLQDPMVEEADLVAQQALGKGTVFSVSYLGAFGKELTNFLDYNLSPTESNVTITVSNPTGTLGPLGPTGTVYTVPTFTSYINTAFGAITDVKSNINSNYSAIVAEVQNHSLKSIQFDMNYTWSHALDFNQNATTTTSTTNWLDPYASPRGNYGNSSFNVPNRVVIWALYNLPDFVHTKNWVSYITNGWSIDDSFQGQSGLPLSITASGFNSGNALLSGWNGGGDTAYIPVLGRNTLKYPRHLVDDARVMKQISFNDRYNLQLFANIFNIVNHQNIDGINTGAYTFGSSTALATTATFNSSSYGTTSSSNSSGFLYTPREVEIAAKFNF